MSLTIIVNIAMLFFSADYKWVNDNASLQKFNYGYYEDYNSGLEQTLSRYQNKNCAINFILTSYSVIKISYFHSEVNYEVSFFLGCASVNIFLQ
jgi:hypothetical protein